MYVADLSAFIAAEDGAVTVDWVVLTGAIVGLGLGAITAVRQGTTQLGSGIETSLTNASVADLGTLGVGGDGDEVFDFQFLFYTDAGTRGFWVASTISDPNVTDEFLGTTYLAVAQEAALRLANGQLTGVTGAGMMIDSAMMYSQVMEARGLTPPTEAPSIEALYREYRQLEG